MTKKSKPNFKKKEPNSRNNREEFAKDLDSNQADRNKKQQNNQQNR